MKEDITLIFSVLWNQVTDLFFVLLVAAAGASFYMGEKQDGIIIAVILSVNVVLGFFQEFKASRASRKLMHLVEGRVYVLRNGALTQVLVGELVLGDVIHLISGSVSPVDAQVTESMDASIDDSMRTGESLPKSISAGETLFAGATVSSGKVIATVLKLGADSSIQQYRTMLERVEKWNSFGAFSERVVKYIFGISLATLLVSMVFLVFVSGKYSLAHFFVFAIAMLVGVVPEVLPLIITLILTSEALMLSKNKVLVKRLASLEGLGAVKFLLTDKTGTITENKLEVSAVDDADRLWEFSNAISEADYERTPMDEAYDAALNAAVSKVKTSPQTVADFQPFKSDIGYEVFTLENGERVIRGIVGKVAAKTAGNHDSALKAALEYEGKGMRVVALAHGSDNAWIFSGFIAFHDPIKADAAQSIKLAHAQGIGVKILTGDSTAVAANVAEELGLIKSPDNVISLENMQVADVSDSQLVSAMVFAKCTPQNKLELIDRYVKLGPVAFLGDGINDALGLKRADIGIAVDNASDIAKESADIILLEKDISPILKSVSTGRRALRNIVTYIIYTLSGNAGTFFSLLIASFFYPVLPMLSIQILLNNLLTDLPLMLIITDHPDPSALKHVFHFRPQKIMKPVLLFGIISSFFDFFYFQLYKHASVGEFQTGWFLLSVLAELALVLSIRSSRPIFKSPPLSMPLLSGILISAALPFVFIYNGFLAAIFHFSPLSVGTVISIAAIVLVYILINEIAKIFIRRKNLLGQAVAPFAKFSWKPGTNRV